MGSHRAGYASHAQGHAGRHVCARSAELDRPAASDQGDPGARPCRRVSGHPLQRSGRLPDGHRHGPDQCSLALSPQFDLRKTYFIVAGIAGINPHHGTLGTTAWAHYLVEFGTQWEVDSRDVPKDWPTGYLGINTKGPNEKPPLDYKTEVFELNPKLQAKAFALSQKVTLSESKESAAWRVKYPYAPANQPPQVTQCDTLAGNTWFSGTRLSERAEVWTRLLTDGKGVYCTTQQEDNSTYEALLRASKAGKVDVNRLAVVRAGSDFDRPYPGYSEVDNLLKYADQGAFVPALENLYRTGNPLVQAIVGDWKNWEKGVPQ
ncbi:putative Purine nucleoside permease [Pseudomonas savastanoi pv. glycinea]|uniref:Purine nucleoside permease n=1 Tax=Pseudomonas savastanoi pv. glycinea TaxID=318 RepID=A0A0P9RMR2_PSESG|nr:putative Purine nucleoside permease [Pseudomonas savastanoi pv. glycinea]RMM66902.1 putative Purine nucleoside permease [Pseudomonas savastanoi pv. glycinea]RMM90306.1 putative Purine nucleoside permease [Pseudomonas savastanoi pv. glycinea]RMN00228.1 putative Purine nucleoside permease [Pseudomonas savastanoi pv. glycinea]RMP57783.1 putative Purine nucleoside permease [Pseudomonas savastanoi pv. glycinea]